jgi:hypothetical protein
MVRLQDRSPKSPSRRANWCTPAFDRQWTRSVAVINGSTLLGIEDGEDVLRRDRSLPPGGGRGLGVRHGTNVAEREDILKPRVPKRLMVDVDPTGIAGERARPHEIRRGLGWADVEQIETAGNFLNAAVGPSYRESGFPSGAAHRHETGFEFQIDPVAFNVVHKGRDILLDPEQYVAGNVEFDGDIADAVRSAPVIAGEIHRLLRCACAFDRQGWLGEERRAAPELLHKLPGVGGKVEAVVGGNPILAQGLFEAGDSAPIQLEPEAATRTR